MNKQQTLIYIIGAGRSGTTLLDIVLGNSDNTISLGEINRFFKRDGVPPKRKYNDEVLLFWDKINKEFRRKCNQIDYKEAEYLLKKNEYHSAFLTNKFNHNINYKKLFLELYNIIINNTDNQIFIESSKYPIRGLNLSKFKRDLSFDVKYIYIKKDPVKVVNSFNKKDIEQPSKSFFSSNLYYLLVNLLCLSVVKTLKNRNHDVVTIKYENLISFPKETLEKIEANLNIDLSKSKEKIKNKLPLSTGFLFDGNRIRLKETLTLRALDNSDAKDVKYYFVRIFNYIVYKR